MVISIACLCSGRRRPVRSECRSPTHPEEVADLTIGHRLDPPVDHVHLPASTKQQGCPIATSLPAAAALRFVARRLPVAICHSSPRIAR